MKLELLFPTDLRLVKGYLRSTILDLTRESFYFISNDLYSLLDTKNYHLIHNEIKQWLFENDLLIYIPSKMKNHFIAMENNWEYPSVILTMIVDVDCLKHHAENKILNIIEEFNVKSFVLNMTQFENYNVEKFLLNMDSSKVDVIEVFDNAFNNNDWFGISRKMSKLKNVVIYQSLINDILQGGYDEKANIYYNTISFSNRAKFKQSIDYFNVNTELYTESLCHNTYFNRKLYISADGCVKNAPELKKSIGNLQEFKMIEELKSVISTKKFQKYWFVHKDLCDVCKFCEFRHMCVDNRIPFERTENEWYHKIECNYNPFIAKWEEEPGYKSLEQCGVISNDTEFSIDHEKIKQINFELWGE